MHTTAKRDLRAMRRLGALAFVVALIASSVLVGSAATAVAAGDGTTCSEVSIATDAAAAPGRSNTVKGTLCIPAGSAATTLQVLVHGGTYSRVYWDLPGFGGRYSYSKVMNAAGYPTLAIDQLGVGRSSDPASVALTTDAQAAALHDVVQAGRAGLGGHAFEQIVIVGHSIGSVTSVVEAATYHDVDGVVLSGLSHVPGALGLARLASYARPAILDPASVSKVPPFDLGYLSAPGSRAVFYRPGEADPAVVAADEAASEPLSAIQLATFPEYIPMSLFLDVPTLLANGQHDVIFCAQGEGGSLVDCGSAAALHNAEAPFFPPAAELETYVLSSSGHILNFTRDAPEWFQAAKEWFQRRYPVA